MLQIAKKKEHYTKSEIMIEGWAFCKIWTTLENLQYAAEGEKFEYTTLYPEFAKIAKKEWYPEFATRILSIARAEMHHEERYKKLLKELKDKTLRKKVKDVEWMCTKCGFIHKGKSPLDICPSCGHDKTYAVVKCETY
jgi:rubrerythrin